VLEEKLAVQATGSFAHKADGLSAMADLNGGQILQMDAHDPGAGGSHATWFTGLRVESTTLGGGASSSGNPVHQGPVPLVLTVVRNHDAVVGLPLQQQSPAWQIRGGPRVLHQ